MIYKNLLLAATIIIWSLMTAAKFAEYDTNYAYAIFALIVSLLTVFLIIISWFVSKSSVKSSSALTVLFLFTSSLVSLFLFVSFYEDYVGRYFRL